MVTEKPFTEKVMGSDLDPDFVGLSFEHDTIQKIEMMMIKRKIIFTRLISPSFKLILLLKTRFNTAIKI